MNALILGQTDINKASVVDNECMLKPTKSSHRDEYIYIYIYSNVTLYIVNIKKKRLSTSEEMGSYSGFVCIFIM